MKEAWSDETTMIWEYLWDDLPRIGAYDVWDIIDHRLAKHKTRSAKLDELKAFFSDLVDGRNNPSIVRYIYRKAVERADFEVILDGIEKLGHVKPADESN